MQVNQTTGTSFGRIGFSDKAVKKAFQEALNKPSRYTSNHSITYTGMKQLASFLIEKENNRHDRLIKIGIKQIKGKNYFTKASTEEVLGTTKRGRQNICLFLLDLIESMKK